MGDSWVNCQSCGHRYGSWLSACPQCGSNNVGFKKKGLGKGKKIAIGVVVAIGLTIVMAYGYSTGPIATEASKYQGLTEKQIQSIKLITESCDNDVALAEGLYGQEHGKLVQERCDRAIANKIADYKAQNGG